MILPLSSKTRDHLLIIVLSLAFVLGMAIALGLVATWSAHPAAMTGGMGYRLALMVCPPFIVVGAVTGVADSTLALLLATGSIVFANGTLYAGVAAFVYWALSTFWRRAHER